jgi:uncharacterized protein (DUF488 family)
MMVGSHGRGGSIAHFADGLAETPGMAAERRNVMMCSEALWWRCHRRLAADRLLVAGDYVWHIGANGRIAAGSAA